MNIMETLKAISRFNSDNLKGMKEIMIKAHALAKLTRQPDESYAHALRVALKTVWRRIKRADSCGKKLYLYKTGDEHCPYDMITTKMSYLKVLDFILMLKECERRGRSAIKNVSSANFYEGNYSKTDLYTMFEYATTEIGVLKNYDDCVGYDGYENFRKELRQFIDNNWIVMQGEKLKSMIIKFIFNYVFGVECRIRGFLRNYGEDV